MNALELEAEVGKVSRAMMTRNTQIGDAIIAYLRTELTDEEIAGIFLISLERLIWFDQELFLWSIKNFVPADVMQEIRNLTSVTIYKQLICKKFVPGQDFSVDAAGKLLLNENAKAAILPHARPSSEAACQTFKS
jgi:hypothetical protein